MWYGASVSQTSVHLANQLQAGYSLRNEYQVCNRLAKCPTYRLQFKCPHCICQHIASPSATTDTTSFPRVRHCVREREFSNSHPMNAVTPHGGHMDAQQLVGRNKLACVLIVQGL